MVVEDYTPARGHPAGLLAGTTGTFAQTPIGPISYINAPWARSILVPVRTCCRPGSEDQDGAKSRAGCFQENRCRNGDSQPVPVARPAAQNPEPPRGSGALHANTARR